MDKSLEYNYQEELKKNGKSYQEFNISIEPSSTEDIESEVSNETKSPEINFQEVGKPKRIIRKYKLIHD